MARSTTLVAATGVLTITAVAVANETVTIGATVYTYKNPAASAGEVSIGTTATTSATNLAAAINGNALNAAHPLVTATSAAGVVTITSRVKGTLANHVPTTETSTVASWGAAAMAGGTGVLATALAGIVALNQMNSEVIFELDHVADQVA